MKSHQMFTAETSTFQHETKEEDNLSEKCQIEQGGTVEENPKNVG
jgi:hypothetical protein